MNHFKHSFLVAFAAIVCLASLTFGQATPTPTPAIPPVDPPEKTFALRLIATKDPDERDRVLKSEPRLVNRQLALEFRKEADRLEGKVPRVDRVAIYKLELRVSEEIADKEQMIDALDLIGYNSDSLEQKLAWYQKALVLCDEIGNKSLASLILAEIAHAYYRADEMETGLNYAAQSLSAAESSNDKVRVARALNELGLIHRVQGNYLASSENLENALAIMRDLGDQDGIPVALNNLALSYYSLGNYAKSIKLYEEAIKLNEDPVDKHRVALNLMNLANVYADVDDSAKAISLYHRSLELELESGGDGGRQMVNIGFIYEELGNYDQAKTYLDKAQALLEKPNNQALRPDLNVRKRLGLIFGGLGRIERLQENYQAATDFQQKALKLYKEIGFKLEIANTLQRLGAICSDQGDFDKAASYFEEALKYYGSEGEARGNFEVLLETSKMQIRQRDYPSALKTIERARSFLDKSGSTSGESELYSTLARVNQGLGRYDQAKANLQNAIRLIETQRTMIAGGSDEQEIAFEQMISPYRQLAEILVSQDDVAAAFSVVERTKARTLLDVIQFGKIDINKAMTQLEREREQRYRDELTSLNAQVANLVRNEKTDPAKGTEPEKKLAEKRLEFEDFHVRLYSAHPELLAHRGEMKPITVEESHSLLTDDKSAILEFAVAENRTFLFVVTKIAAKKLSLKVFTLDVKDKELGKRVETYRAKVASGDLDFQKGSRDLYDLLLKPAEAQLAGKTNITIVPDGVLWDLPFQALQNGQGKYLVEQAAVSYAPSLTALREMSKKAQKSDKSGNLELLAFGNPVVGKETAARVGQVFMDEKLEPLPEAERLVMTLGKMYGPTRSKIYTGADARKQAAVTESPKYRILQFATHGILNNVAPMYSHLVLSRDGENPNDDGLLEAWEMKDLDLKADMVVLSACDTARGKIAGGEGMIGMTWAMFIAGTPTTVASQWKVESSSTTELMLEFHRQLLTGKTTKAEALRRASLKLMKSGKYTHPSYWAGWVLVGDGN